MRHPLPDRRQKPDLIAVRTCCVGGSGTGLASQRDDDVAPLMGRIEAPDDLGASRARKLLSEAA